MGKEKSEESLKYEEFRKVFNENEEQEFWKRITDIKKEYYGYENSTEVQIYFVSIHYYEFGYSEELGSSINFLYIKALIEVIGKQRYREFEKQVRGRKMYINLKRIQTIERNKMICDALERGASRKEVAIKYNTTVDNVRKIYGRYRAKVDKN